MKEKKYNLFIYGSLRDPSVLQSVCGLSFTLRPSRTGSKTLRAELALLHQHRKASPDNVYFYAVPDPTGKIEGFIIYDIPQQAMSDIDKYEGKFYERETVNVNTAAGLVEAIAYLVKPKKMQKQFGDRFHVNLIHELWLRKRIEKFFEATTRPGEKSLDADIERRAKRELLGTTERDLVLSHLGSDAVSDYYLEHELDRPVGTIKHLIEEPDAQPYIHNYLGLVVKQVFMNQFEQIIQSRYRYELERLSTSQRYFTRSMGLLIALRMVNASKKAIEMVIQRCLEAMPPDGRFDLIDYVKYAVLAADSSFDSRVARSEIERIIVNRQPGLVPMGAELELSNLGYRALVSGDPDYIDHDFNSFKYFSDFKLDVLCWKLGGYIDDHSGEFSGRQKGFLELAPGRLNFLGEISKPATADPWVLNQLIREIAIFYPVKPHSLHLTFQLRKNQIGKQKMLPLSFVKCLLILGGGIQRKKTGHLVISRVTDNEIRQKAYGEELIITRTSKRKYLLHPEDFRANQTWNSPIFTQQYKFMRLEERANHEPLIMTLKGLQLGHNPCDYLTSEQLSSSKKLQAQCQELKKWSANPTTISRRTKGRFLDTVHQGLMQEGHNKPYHQLHYIDWAMGAIDLQLRLFNQQILTKTAQQQQSDILKLINTIKPQRT